MAGNKKILKTVLFLVVAAVIIGFIITKATAPGKKADKMPEKATTGGKGGAKNLLVDAYVV
jgi:membrane fusion protein (multidrug efflux system)